MQLHSLTYRLGDEKSGTVDFLEKTPLLTLAETENCALVPQVLSLAMFGAEEHDFESLPQGAAVCLDFSANGKNYRVERVYQDGETTTVTEVKGDALVSLAPQTAKKLLNSVFGRREACFFDAKRNDSEFQLDERFLRSVLKIGEGTAELVTKRLAEEQAQLSAQNDILKALKYAEGHALCQNAGKLASLDTLAAEKADIYKNLKRADYKIWVANEAKMAQDALAEFVEKNKDVLQYADILARDGQIAQLKELLAERDRLQQEARRLLQKNAEQLARGEMLKKKTEGGAKAEKDLEAEFIYKIERVRSLEKRFTDAVCAADEENSEVRQAVESFFEANDPQIVELQNKKKRLDSEYDALLLSITSLEDKKKGLVHPMSYKKAVIDGTVMENKIDRLTLAIEDGTRRSGELQLELSAKQEDIADLNAKISTKTAQKAKLLQEVLQGKFVEKEDALNADSARKNAFYSNFILIENQSAEIKALKEKISKLKEQNAANAEKREELNSAKIEIEIHRLKLKNKLHVLEETYSEKIAENIYAEQASKLEYGKRCPVCDSYITKKKEVPQVDAGAVLADMQKCKAEIVEAEEKVQKILLKLGAYLSTTASGDAYLVSLENTLTKKEALVKKLLKDCGAESIGMLEPSLRQLGENSRTLNAKVETLAKLDAEILATVERKDLLETSIQQLSGREAKRIRINVEKAQVELDAILKDYRKLMPVFGGKPAKELLSGSLIDEIELETVEGDLVTQTKNFREVTVQKIETDRLLILLKNRLIADVKDTESGNAVDILLRTMAKTAQQLSAELKTANEELEDVKVRLSAVRHVKQRADTEGGESGIAQGEGKILAEKAQVAAECAEDNAKALLATLGEKSYAEALRGALGAEEKIKMELKLTEYKRDLNRLTVQAELSASRPVTLDLIPVEALEARLVQISAEEEQIARQTARLAILAEEKEARGTERASAEAEISAIEQRIKAIEVVAAAIKDGRFLEEILADEVRETAKEEMFHLSRGKLVLGWDNSVATLKRGDKVLSQQDQNAYVSCAFYLSLIAAISAPAQVLNGTAPTAVVVVKEDEKKDVAELCADFCKTYPIAVCAADGKVAKQLLAGM